MTHQREAVERLVAQLRQLAEHNRKNFPVTREQGFIALGDEAADLIEALTSEEPTEAMIDAGCDVICKLDGGDAPQALRATIRGIYLAMRSQQPGNSPLLTPEEEDELVARINGNPNLHPKEQP